MPDQIDVLSLGGFVFDSFATPDLIPGGGRQSIVVHKLPGGSRVIDVLGRDDMDIAWRGQFFNSAAINQALQLDALRIQGSMLTLTYAGLSFPVVIQSFFWSLRRYPMWVEYAITCTVVQSAPGTQGASSSSSGVDSAVSSDASQASGVANGSQSGMTVGEPTNPAVPFTDPNMPNPFGGPNVTIGTPQVTGGG